MIDFIQSLILLSIAVYILRDALNKRNTRIKKENQKSKTENQTSDKRETLQDWFFKNLLNTNIHVYRLYHMVDGYPIQIFGKTVVEQFLAADVWANEFIERAKININDDNVHVFYIKAVDKNYHPICEKTFTLRR